MKHPHQPHLLHLITPLAFIICSFSIILLVMISSKLIEEKRCGKDWDVLIFTQSWPNTVCMIWEEDSPSNHTCRLPKEKDIWTIHGIWPTKFGTLGPVFCNSSYKFNVSQLLPIESNLTDLWLDVHVPDAAHSFWKHEWLKHGTCCSSLESLNTELKYFQTGLNWLGEYNMKGVLASGGIFPDSNSTTDLITLWLALKTQLGYNPSLTCFLDKKTHQYYLQEIRICFDKDLELTDCDGIKLSRGLRWKPMGNCPDDKPILFPSSVPPLTRQPLPPPSDPAIMSFYKVIKYVMWMTS